MKGDFRKRPLFGSITGLLSKGYVEGDERDGKIRKKPENWRPFCSLTLLTSFFYRYLWTD